MKKKGLLLLLLAVWATAMQAQRVVVTDQQTGGRLEEVLVVSAEERGKLLGHTDGEGCFSAKGAAGLRVVLLRVGYHALEVRLGMSACDTLRLVPKEGLKEVVVRGGRPLVTYKADRIVYNVEADSAAQKEKAIETLRKVPGLMVNRRGEISADFGQPIKWRINGLRDPMISNATEMLSALDARYLKRIEVVMRPGMEHEPNTIVLNIVPKGRLEGYLLTATSKATDQNWRNGLWTSTKSGRLRLSGSYYNNWLFAHSSSFRSEEVRHNALWERQTLVESRTSGIRGNDHNVEVSASYDVDDHSILSAYGRVHQRQGLCSGERSLTRALQADGSLTYSYRQRKDYRLDSPEYYASLSFERMFGEEAENGKFFLGYDYYGRPYRDVSSVTYHEVDSVVAGVPSISNLRDYIEELNSGEHWHTMELEYNRRWARHHCLILGAKALLRLDSDRKATRHAPPGSGLYKLDEASQSRYRRTQMLYTPLVSYTYNKEGFHASAGVRMEIDRESMSHRTQGYHFFRTFVNALPGASLSYAFAQRGTLSLGYALSVSRPSVTALSPYVDRTVVNRLAYGNTHLKPQRNHAVTLGGTLRLGQRDAYNLSLNLFHHYADRMILDYRFLVGDTLHLTKGNLGIRRSTGLQASAHKRYGNFFLRLSASLEQVRYTASRIQQRNKGLFFRTHCMGEYELPKDYYVEVEGSYHTDYIMLQGRGGENLNYNLSLTKKLCHNRLTLQVSASSFLPLYDTQQEQRGTANYAYAQSRRYFQASFLFSVRYTLGKLKARVKETEKTIENTDVKTDYDE